MTVRAVERDRQAAGLAIGRQPSRAMPRSPGRVLAVASGKGGVGKTNLAVNLGIALSRRRRKVLVFDGDLGLANVDVLLGLRVERTLRDVVAGRADLNDVLVEGPGGILIAPGGGGLAGLANLDAFGRGRLLRQLAEIEGRFDFVLVDTAAGVGDDVIEFLRSVGEVMLVTTPEPTALTDAYALVKVTTSGAPSMRFGLVVNNCLSMAEGADAAMRLREVTRRFLSVQIPLWAILPRADEVGLAVRSQLAVIEAYPESSFARGVQQLCNHVIGEDSEPAQAPFNTLSQAIQGFFHRLGSSAMISAQRRI
ncbi:MAG: MinD/ParA family protein [Anaerolineae bacterium]